MNLSDLLKMHDYSPRVHTDFPYEYFRPVVDKIADEIWTWSLPSNDQVPDHLKKFALMWADHVRNEVPQCCVEDALRAFSAILETLIQIMGHCTSHECTEHANHDFLELVGKTIDNGIASYLRKVAAAQEIMRRSN